jgi:hypothetical protein
MIPCETNDVVLEDDESIDLYLEMCNRQLGNRKLFKENGQVKLLRHIFLVEDGYLYCMQQSEIVEQMTRLNAVTYDGAILYLVKINCNMFFE